MACRCGRRANSFTPDIRTSSPPGLTKAWLPMTRSIFAEKVNAQIEAFNAQVRAMLPLFRSRSAANTRRAKALGSAIRDLLPDLFAERPPPRAGEPALETLAAARKRIENQWSVEL